MADAVKSTQDSANLPGAPLTTDNDPVETQEWLDSLNYVINSKGPERAQYLLSLLEAKAKADGVDLPIRSNTPYINTIPLAEQPDFPGNREIERRIKSIIRWNAMAMVAKANKNIEGIGGHISTFASSATLYEVAFNHFFRGRGESVTMAIRFTSKATLRLAYTARAFLEGRLTEEQLDNFRRELQPTPGLSSYPHPWLMPDFWEYPTVSMGLAPIMAIYQARFNRIPSTTAASKTPRSNAFGLFLATANATSQKRWARSRLAAREKLDNLIFVVNCNLQRLDGPVRGNGKIIQELEAIFRGAGWNVIKVVWGDDWDPLLEKDETGLLVKRMGEVVDGQYQKYVAMPGAYIREHFFGKYPELLELVKKLL